ncbi:MAG: hypothetical protein IPN62_02595 [Flavobacteriales bacterium]|nr:hypothetical protein [Flavobacteriales bacterium]
MLLFRRLVDLVLLTTALTVAISVSAQESDPGRPQRRYMRPSWTTMIVTETGEKERKVLDPFAGLSCSSKFNDHGIGVPSLNVGGGEGAARDAAMLAGINGHSATIVGKWFDRAADGTMSTTLIQERGRYSQADADRMIQLLSQVDRSGDQGWQLLDLTYVVVYDVTSVEYKQMTSNAAATSDAKKTGAERTSNLLDALGKVANGGTPSKENTSSQTKGEMEGYQITYTADLYKIQWTDSLERQFVQRYWNPREQPDAAKAAAWNGASFPFVKVASFTDNMPEWRPKKDGQPPVDELLLNFAPRMQKQAIERFSKKVQELRPRAPLVQAYPLTARLGTKEGVKVNDRFVALEYKQGPKGYQLKRKGVVRAYVVTKNQQDVEGRTAPSVFQQQGGWKVWPGMSLEERHDLGLNVSGGYQLGLLDDISTGVALMFKSNILGQALQVPNLYVGVNLTLPMASGLDVGGMVMPSYLDSVTLGSGDVIEPGEWKGSGSEIGILLSKEFYLSNRGNLYLEPTIAYTFLNWKFTGNGSITFNDKVFDDIGGSAVKWKDNAENAFSYKSSMFSLGCGIGHHFGPIALEVRPMVGYRRFYEYNGESSWRSQGDPSEVVVRENASLTEDARSLSDSFGSSLAASAVLALKVRF